MTAHGAREAIMLQPNSISALQPRWRGGLSIALFACLVLGAALASANGKEEAPTVREFSGTSQPPTLPAPALATSPAVAEQGKPMRSAPSPNEERQRQLLMLLLMNSAGSLHPYGGLGR
jgi:hypothetical protein